MSSSIYKLMNENTVVLSTAQKYCAVHNISSRRDLEKRTQERVIFSVC